MNRTPGQIINRAAAQLEIDPQAWGVLQQTGVVKIAARWPIEAAEIYQTTGPVLASLPIVVFSKGRGYTVWAAYGGLVHPIIRGGEWNPCEDVKEDD